MYSAFRPATHGKIEKVACIDRRSFAEYVVMLVNVEYKLGCVDHTFLDSLRPERQGLMVVLENGIYWTISPGKQFIELFERLVKELEVIEINVQNHRHQ